MHPNSIPNSEKSQQGGVTMTLKGLIAVVGTMALISIGVAACGGGDDDTTAETAADTSQEAGGSAGGGGSDGPVTITASVPPTDHGWLAAISKNAQAQADEYDDVDFKLLEAADADS